MTISVGEWEEKRIERAEFAMNMAERTNDAQWHIATALLDIAVILDLIETVISREKM